MLDDTGDCRLPRSKSAGALDERGDMKTRILLALLLSGTGAAVHAEGPYGELRWGFVAVEPMVSSGGTVPLSSLGNAAGITELTYNDPMSFGGEAGFAEVLGTPFNVSLALDTFRSELDQMQVRPRGDAADAPSLEVDPEGLRERNVSFDHRVLLLTANVFYEREIKDVKAYAGAGYGMVFIGDADSESGPILHLGARYEVASIGYVGLRVSRFKSGGPLHTATGLKFDDFEFTSVNLSFGLEM